MKTIIIDDQKAMHFILSRLLTPLPEVELVGAFQSTAEAEAFLQLHDDVDLAFVDIEMPQESGLTFAKRIRGAGHTIKLVFVTSHKEFALSAFEVYAYDYIVKPVSEERLRSTVARAVAETGGQSSGLPPTVPMAAASEMEGDGPLNQKMGIADALTRREMEVLELISLGLSNKEIASRLYIIEGTVKNHIANLFGKLQVKNRVQAIAAARELKLLS